MKRTLRITFLSIGMLFEIAYLIFAVLNMYIFWVTADDSIPMAFFITMTIHAVLALVISIAGIVRAVKNRKWVLISGFFMQLWLLWMAFSVAVYIAVQVLFPFVFLVFGILVYIMFYAIAKTFKGSNTKQQNRGVNTGYNEYFFLDSESSWEAVMYEYCGLFNKKENNLTDYDDDLIYNYSVYWFLYLVIWVIKNDFYSDSFKENLGNTLIAQVKADMFNYKELSSKISYFSNDEVCDDVLPFLIKYAEPFCRDSYWNDYLEVIKAEQNRYAYAIPEDGNYLEYCVDFNINIYYELEKKIDRAYYYFKQKNYTTTTFIKD